MFNYRDYNSKLFTQEVKQLEFFIGLVKLSGQTDWSTLDSAICQAFKVSCRAAANHYCKVFIMLLVSVLVNTKVFR